MYSNPNLIITQSNPNPGNFYSAIIILNIMRILCHHVWVTFVVVVAVLVVVDVFAAVLQVKGGVADADGRLCPGDQILTVNGDDMRTATQDYAAQLLKAI